MNKILLTKIWNFISEQTKLKNDLDTIVHLQKEYFMSDNMVNDFFADIKKEYTFNEVYFDKFLPYISIIKESFKDSFEFSGGKEYRFFHSLIVLHLTNLICKELDINQRDKEICFISAIFHDIGKSQSIYNLKSGEDFDIFEKNHSLAPHEEVGAEMTEQILKEHFDSNFIDNVKIAITGRQKDNLYYKILTDADNSAEVGNIGIFRLFYYNSCMNRTLEESINYWLSSSYFRKIKKIKTSSFDISKNIMSSRIDTMKNILESFTRL